MKLVIPFQRNLTRERWGESGRLVCALYGLTPEEIKIVESASVQTSARQAGAAK